jgi:hypothetical protein
MECSLQAKYKYEDGLPSKRNAKTVFGSIVHESLQYYYESRGDESGAIKMFMSKWGHPEKAGHVIDYWPRYTSFDGLMKKGKEVIKYVHQSHRWQDFTVLATEHPFLVPFGPTHELTGFVDLVGIEKSGTGTELLKIIDFKTASKAPSIGELALDPQLTTYSYAATRPEFWLGVEGDPRFPAIDNGEWWLTMTKGMPHRAIWWGVWVGRQIDAGPRTQKDFERLYRVCTEIQKAKDADVFMPKIGSACTFCDYKNECALEIPVAIAQTEDKTDPNRWI